VCAGSFIGWAKGEPNNRFSPEFCGVADLTRMSRGAGGWADENCVQQNIYMCRVTRELHARTPSCGCLFSAN
jgi:hypothetical protein